MPLREQIADRCPLAVSAGRRGRTPVGLPSVETPPGRPQPDSAVARPPARPPAWPCSPDHHLPPSRNSTGTGLLLGSPPDAPSPLDDRRPVAGQDGDARSPPAGKEVNGRLGPSRPSRGVVVVVVVVAAPAGSPAASSTSAREGRTEHSDGRVRASRTQKLTRPLPPAPSRRRRLTLLPLLLPPGPRRWLLRPAEQRARPPSQKLTPPPAHGRPTACGAVMTGR